MLSGALLPWRQSYEVNLRLSVMGGSFAQLWSLVKRDIARLQDSIQQGCSGSGDSKRFHVSSQRQRYELVACTGHTRTQSAALAAQHQHDAAAVVGGRVGPRRDSPRALDAHRHSTARSSIAPIGILLHMHWRARAVGPAAG